MKLKGKILTVTGAVSTAIGGIGAGLAGLGLCPCALVPILSFAGLISLLIGFLTKYKLVFLTMGVFLLIMSFVMHKKKKVCSIHSKVKK